MPKYVEVRHPGLGSTARVPAGAARALVREGGWQYTDPSSVISTEDSNIAEVLTQVGDDPVKARAALDAEKAGKNRSTLTSKLAEIVGATPED